MGRRIMRISDLVGQRCGAMAKLSVCGSVSSDLVTGLTQVPSCSFAERALIDVAPERLDGLDRSMELNLCRGARSLIRKPARCFKIGTSARRAFRRGA